MILISAAGCRTVEAKGSKQLTLAVFMSGVLTNNSEFVGGQTFLTSLDLTLELLNNDSRLLPGYFLNASIADPRVSSCTVFTLRNNHSSDCIDKIQDRSLRFGFTGPLFKPAHA